MITAELEAALSNRSTPLAQVLKTVSAAEASLAEAGAVKIGVSSSVTVDLLGLYLRREAALAGVRADILAGGYDDPIGDMERFAREGTDRAVILPFFDNILPAFEAQVARDDPDLVDSKEAELRGRYRLAFERGKDLAAVYVGLFHRLGDSASPGGADLVAATVERYNAALRDEAMAFQNVQFLDVEAAVSAVGRANAFDMRFYFRSKAPYSAALLSELAGRIANASRGFGTHFYKALAIDCDNTLWGGVIGEDLLAGIKLDPFDYPGNIFWRVQQEIAALEKAGLLLCLCTKNNPADVEEVFRKHPHMVLQENQIVAKRVNWTDKVSNLEALAAELNIGLDSMIFLDDSPVEAESVRSRLPMVKMVQVPASLPTYPAVIEDMARLYLGGGISADSRSKTEQYRIRAAATKAKAAFGSHEDYLASLALEAELHVNRPAEVPRISELSMKSNQFNLTTRRYPEAAVRALMERPDSEIVSITVRNKFGDSGLTGIVVLHFEGETARIDNFLMSCRVLGQGVEFAVWDVIAARCRARGAKVLEAEFLSTAKNAQVRDYYDRLGLELISDEPGERRYRHALDAFSPPSSPWIKISHD